MSHTWKFLPLAVMAAIGAFMLLPGSNVSRTPTTASAAVDCDTTHRLRIEIINDDTDDRITVAGTDADINLDPRDGLGSHTFTDNGSGDDSDTVGRIDINDACSASATSDYEVQITLPDALSTCDFVDDDTQTTDLTANTTLQFHVEGCPSLTPTATATSTVGPAQTVVVASSNSTLACGATSIVTVTVKDGTGKPVANGTLVNIVADLGSVSPTSGQTTADGSVFVFYTAPSNAGGKATISAASGSALGSAEVTINCNNTPTQAPPPTTAAGGGIQPPNTGDGGLAGNNSWHTYAGIALILSSVIGTLAVVRPRA
jgi:hypothetical protein